MEYIYQITDKTNIDEMGMVIDNSLISVSETEPTGDNVLVGKWEKENWEQMETKRKEKEIIEGLGAKDKTDAIIKQLNLINESLVANNVANDDLKNTVNIIQTVLNK